MTHTTIAAGPFRRPSSHYREVPLALYARDSLFEELPGCVTLNERFLFRHMVASSSAPRERVTRHTDRFRENERRCIEDERGLRRHEREREPFHVRPGFRFGP